MIDPSAGSGSFVIQAMLKMREGVAAIEGPYSKDTESIRNNILNSEPVNKWAENYCVGLEINSDLGLAAQVNMLLHGDGSSAMFAGPKHGDGLLNFANYPTTCPSLTEKHDSYDWYPRRVCEQFDVVLTNPPFASEITNDDLERYKKSLHIATDSKKSEDLFCDRWFQLLKPSGRLGVILPNSVLDAKRTSVGLMWLLRYFWIRCIVSLPSNAFYPHTMTKTSIIFAQKKTDDELMTGHNTDSRDNLKENGQIIMATASHLGYRRTSKTEIPIDLNDLPAIADKIKEQDLWK